MAINYTQQQSDPLLQSSSASSDYTPYINAARQGADLLSNAAYRAGNTAASNYGSAQGQIRQGNLSSTAYNSPYTALGLSATQRLQNLMTDPSSIKMDPAYQFNLDQQMQQLQNKNVAGGKLLSGQNIDDIARLTSGYASNAYQQQIANNLAQAGLGQTSAINQGNQDFNAGQAIGQWQGQIGDTLGNADVAAANAQARGLYDAARGLVAQSTVKSTPFSSGGTTGGVNNLGTKDSTIKMGEKSFEDFQKELDSRYNNAAANQMPYIEDDSGTAIGGGGSSGGGGGASGGSSGGGFNFGSGSPIPGQDAKMNTLANNATDTAAGNIAGNLGNALSAAKFFSSSGTSRDFGGTGGGGGGSLGNLYSNTGLTPDSMPGTISGGVQGAIDNATNSIGKGLSGASTGLGSLNPSKGYLPGETKAQYDIRQQRIWEAMHPDVVAQAVARGNRAPGSVFGG